MPSRPWMLVFSGMATILVGLSCLIPPSKLPSLHILPELGWDKLLHLLAFYVLASLWFLSWNGGSRQWITILIAGAVYGLAIEWAQHAMHLGRDADWADALFDTLGVVIGLRYQAPMRAILHILNRRLPFVN